jgi:para-aminobenzoate synthetase component 2
MDSLSKAVGSTPEITREIPIRIAVVDNRDSFVYNLVRYLIELGVEVEIFENSVKSEELESFAGILLSPGPGDPLSAGNCIEIVHFADKYKKPLLGVCLGHQVIAAAFNFPVVGARELIHGKTSIIKHNGEGVFANIPDNFRAARYHSLATSDISSPLKIDAVTSDQTIMGISHLTSPIYGVQFHPESILTEHGYLLLKNWLEIISNQNC